MSSLSTEAEAAVLSSYDKIRQEIAAASTESPVGLVEERSIDHADRYSRVYYRPDGYMPSTHFFRHSRFHQADTTGATVNSLFVGAVAGAMLGFSEAHVKRNFIDRLKAIYPKHATPNESQRIFYHCGHRVFQGATTLAAFSLVKNLSQNARGEVDSWNCVLGSAAWGTMWAAHTQNPGRGFFAFGVVSLLSVMHHEFGDDHEH